MKFCITASKDECVDPPPRNPFRCGIGNFGRIRTITRTWEFEAKNKSEVRRFWAEAQKQYLQNVVGFKIVSIEPLCKEEK